MDPVKLEIETTDRDLAISLIDWLNTAECKPDSTVLRVVDETGSADIPLELTN